MASEGKRIKVYYDDGSGRVTWKEGIHTQTDDFSLTIDGQHVIPKGRIVRIEVQVHG